MIDPLALRIAAEFHPEMDEMSCPEQETFGSLFLFIPECGYIRAAVLTRVIANGVEVSVAFDTKL